MGGRTHINSDQVVLFSSQRQRDGGRETHRRPPGRDPLARPGQVALPLQVRLQPLARPHEPPRPPQKAPPNPDRLLPGDSIGRFSSPLHQSLGEPPSHISRLPAQPPAGPGHGQLHACVLIQPCPPISMCFSCRRRMNHMVAAVLPECMSIHLKPGLGFTRRRDGAAILMSLIIGQLSILMVICISAPLLMGLPVV